MERKKGVFKHLISFVLLAKNDSYSIMELKEIGCVLLIIEKSI